MERKHLLILLSAVLLISTVWAATAGMFNETYTFSMYSTIKEKVEVLTSTELDSFVHVDTIGNGVATWVSPLEVMRIYVDTLADSADYTCKVAFASEDTLDASFVSSKFSLKVTPTVYVPSHAYTDTIFLAADTFVVSWTSPATGGSIAMVCDTLLKAINDSTAITDSVTATDGTTYYLVTSNFSEAHLAAFSIRTDVFQTVTTNFTTTAAWLVDTLVYRINHVTDLKDSVTAEDSATYVKVVAKFGTESHGGRWDLDLSTNLHSDSSFTDKKMVADSMSYYAMEEDSITAHVTVTAGDTSYFIELLIPGDTIHIGIGDTMGDTSLTTATVQYKHKTDTLYLANCVLWNGFKGRIIVSPAADTVGGFGKRDTCVIVLKSRNPATGQYIEFDSSFSEGFPDTLDFDHVGKDSLYLQEMILIMTEGDSVYVAPGDTAAYNITVKGKVWYLN